MDETPYNDLEPDLILDALESVGLVPDGHLLALNSYENRVYQIGIEEAEPVVAKFYRPGRWSDEAIREEHSFTRELAEHELPVVAPRVFGGEALHFHRGYRFAVFPRVGGRAPELEDEDTLTWIGRLMGRMHAVGRSGRFRHRETHSIERFGRRPAHGVLASSMLPAHLADRYREASGALLDAVTAAFERAGDYTTLRIHGDCHPGNLLWGPRGPLFVDLDDCITGPAVQDLWMLLSGDRENRTVQLAAVLEGYEQFERFDPRELHMVEALRGLRMVHQAGWVLERWADPAFPRAFPWIGEVRWWEDHVSALAEQAEHCEEPPLAVA